MPGRKKRGTYSARKKAETAGKSMGGKVGKAAKSTIRARRTRDERLKGIMGEIKKSRR